MTLEHRPAGAPACLHPEALPNEVLYCNWRPDGSVKFENFKFLKTVRLGTLAYNYAGKTIPNYRPIFCSPEEYIKNNFKRGHQCNGFCGITG